MNAHLMQQYHALTRGQNGRSQAIAMLRTQADIPACSLIALTGSPSALASASCLASAALASAALAS